MFSIEEIISTHQKVKSGADFPAYIQAIKALGVTHYETYVADGRIDYHGADDFTAHAPAKYDVLAVAEEPDHDAFIKTLKTHQQGGSDFLTFIRSCATYGVDKWVVNMDEMSCTYFDTKGQSILREHIPS